MIPSSPRTVSAIAAAVGRHCPTPSCRTSIRRLASPPRLPAAYVSSLLGIPRRRHMSIKAAARPFPGRWMCTRRCSRQLLLRRRLRRRHGARLLRRVKDRQEIPSRTTRMTLILTRSYPRSPCPRWVENEVVGCIVNVSEGGMLRGEIGGHLRLTNPFLHLVSSRAAFFFKRSRKTMDRMEGPFG